MKRAIVYTSDLLLYRRIVLLFSGEFTFSRAENGDLPQDFHDVTIVDRDTCPTVFGGDVILCRGEGADKSNDSGAVIISLPFSYEEMEKALYGLKNRNTGRLFLVKEERAAVYDGVTVRLTDVEYRLLCALLSVPIGEYVTKQRLVEEVWGEGVDGGVLNVYVHYLREKLEKNGERIIVSSRNLGYKINERTVAVC